MNTPRPVFLEFVDSEADHHTANYIAEQMKIMIERCGSKRFCGLITDNAAAMKNAARIVRTTYPWIIATTCFCHSLDLFLCDIFKVLSIVRIFEDDLLISKTIRNGQTMKAEFTRICTDKKINVTLILPATTRWSSHCRCLENFTKLKKCLQLFALDSKDLSELDKKREKKNLRKIADIIMDSTFWANVDDCLSLIKPIVDVIVKIQTDEPNIHTIYPLFHQLQSNLPDIVLLSILEGEERELVLTKLTSCREEYVTPLFCTAYRLNPCYNDLLTPDQELDVTEFISQLCENLDMSDEEVGKYWRNLLPINQKQVCFQNLSYGNYLKKFPPFNGGKIFHLN